MHSLNRRHFLSTSLGTMAAAAWHLGNRTAAQEPAPAQTASGATGRPDTLFLTWQRDPTTTMTIQWIGPQLTDEEATISYSVRGQNEWQTAVPRRRPYPMTMNQFAYRAEVTELSAGTEYQFRIGA